MRQTWALNDGWHFGPYVLNRDESQMVAATQVSLPHSVVETPLTYVSESSYQGKWQYQRTLELPMPKESRLNPCYYLKFDGAAHYAEVLIDGVKVAEHMGGYTGFEVPLQGKKPGESLVVTVLIDSSEQLNCPPFGHVVDYLTYGGLYREVWLVAKPFQGFESLYAFGEDLLTDHPILALQIEHNLCLSQDGSDSGGGTDLVDEGVLNDTGATLELTLVEAETKSLTLAGGPLKWQLDLSAKGQTIKLPLPSIDDRERPLRLWDIDHPQRYVLHARLFFKRALQDEMTLTIGLREAKFTQEGFFLNGRQLKLKGINRHQSYPYVGYAMPRGPQVADAHILKHELGMNAVRTAHYPQSHHFIEACDAIGLLVFTEIPGWQHIGDENWQAYALQMTKEMVVQYRHHPSIILWGVRINESIDSEGLYTKTNEMARHLDPLRGTGGVRYLRNSQLLEDVYTFNDFSYNGIVKGQGGILPRERVTKSHGGYLVSEYNGHMYPTKSYDTIKVRIEHALRHAHVLSAIWQQPGVAGGFAWCFTDYNTHKDFGSGDGICHHGLMDMFRNPKLAAAVYRSQKAPDQGGELAIGSELHIGDYPGGFLEPVPIFTNGDTLKVYRNRQLVGTYTRQDTIKGQDKDFSGLANPPMLLPDLIGDAMAVGENYSQKKAERIKRLLLAGARYGTDHLPLWAKGLALRLILLDGFRPSDGMRLYAKYIGNWGDAQSTYAFEAYSGETCIARKTLGDMSIPTIVATADRYKLIEGSTYDVASVRLKSCDAGGNTLPYDFEVIHFKVEGPLALIGPQTISLRGGMGGTYLKTTGQAGKAKLEITRAGSTPVVIAFEIEITEGEKI